MCAVGASPAASGADDGEGGAESEGGMDSFIVREEEAPPPRPAEPQVIS